MANVNLDHDAWLAGMKAGADAHFDGMAVRICISNALCAYQKAIDARKQASNKSGGSDDQR